MDEHTPYELAYKNGYAEGHEKGYKEGFLRGFDAGKPKWISVKERLPENICPVLVALEGISTAFNGWYHDGKWWTVGAGTRPFTQKVTHWMPLPEPPTTCHMTSKQQPPKGE